MEQGWLKQCQDGHHFRTMIEWEAHLWNSAPLLVIGTNVAGFLILLSSSKQTNFGNRYGSWNEPQVFVVSHRDGMNRDAC